MRNLGSSPEKRALPALHTPSSQAGNQVPLDQDERQRDRKGDDHATDRQGAAVGIV